MPRENQPYPPIADYALIGDSNSAALVSRSGSVDWCCIRRLDAGSCFGRLLDWEKGGYCAVTPAGEEWDVSRRYVESSLVLESTFKVPGGEARLYDFFAMPSSREEYPYRQLFRVLEGVRGHAEFSVGVFPRFDYGELDPWLRQEGVRLYSALGGDDGLLIYFDEELMKAGDHGLEATVTVHAGERVRLMVMSVPPERLDLRSPEVPEPEEIDRRLEETLGWWRGWTSRFRYRGIGGPGVLRSATVIKGLMNDLTGAVAAAATTSLPERPGGPLNWDYRYSWIRDSFFAVRSLAEIGFEEEADRFRRFIERSAAGSADQLQIMYGMGGERRLNEFVLENLEGYRGARPVRVGNAAAGQLQLDVYGELLELAWRWHRRGNSPDDDYWRFLLDIVDAAAERWREPDSGIWEVRDDPQHFVHSKVMCWAALDKGLRLAEECMRRAPERRWAKARQQIREAVESEGYDAERGVFTRSFESRELDAALLLLPRVGFVEHADERMVRTVQAVREELEQDGLLLRYRRKEGEEEGAFLACSFWLVECLAHQGRLEEARELFDRALVAGNDLGLFSEEYDPASGEALGNFPQALTHLSHIEAAIAISRHLPAGAGA
ncbi:glycoside hydrolase 15-related [Rubrobacter xylanophilus DSM 9941]|uniref:Glycoside hydrolase 15-related n=1 Tax=Rubrobacter xylanophilus (strain DSM 9941 / JCM 11954 / NBRC 16129 / PRD-1) TaxID=266117 RepID=Q1ASF9_RUBXD|nr:glycoside hydrolase family 15 protein [Rubrobacter xylanophilus]ABG05669.1 glycoside hydrolase 15-related [Rubrobacter xylanophilus DSM 9941]